MWEQEFIKRSGLYTGRELLKEEYRVGRVRLMKVWTEELKRLSNIGA